jgi:dihydrodipicolinate synthase/N-acetylneuraminate lyase
MPVKACLAKMGMIENVLRLPLTPVLDATSKKLDAILKELGLI